MRSSVFLLLVLSTILASCSKSKTEKPAAVPTKALLIAPNRDEACFVGENISETESKVTFKWSNTENTSSYEIVVKNLLTNVVSTQTSSGTSISINLLRNTPYSWKVISKSDAVSQTAESDSWRFYNSGPELESFVPYPAELVSPVVASTVDAVNGKISLDWTANDLDNDISNYDVYFGTSANPGLHTAKVSASNLNDLSVSSNTYYYCRIVTRDSKGNTSDSGIFFFKVN